MSPVQIDITLSPITDSIHQYIESITAGHRKDLREMHEHMLQLFPKEELWFLDGKDDTGKVVSNPNIGYGSQLISTGKKGKRLIYKVGLCATTKGISIYLIGIQDKNHLHRTYSERIGKARITGYCISFKSLLDIHRHVLDEMIQAHMTATVSPSFDSE